ncbi:uncharacterized protein MKK02DRAFT_30300 [Dioszegia hungarica]|uniref:MARVEL domain-containing protein n=1 Tax=Dioszegia hungarica TaxID=4972 RepID=A0AA38LR30_9TREE|nr:uncharacterized protein MKK02DRAFT_30300 [Dioszegia hungarica]KAI9632505.1 hypothetical protein MKK02DRAFT_30300 [Dioszegia hungarica]
MPTVRTFKSFLLGLLLVVAYCSFVLNIIQIVKVKRGGETYPAAVVALLVATLLQTFHSVIQFARGSRGKMFVAKNIAIANGILALFVLASVIATTVLRDTTNYCGPANTIRNDCSGVLKGTMGLGWSTFGLQLIYLGFLAYLVKGHGNWNEQLWNIPYVPAANADMDKAPAH